MAQEDHWQQQQQQEAQRQQMAAMQEQQQRMQQQMHCQQQLLQRQQSGMQAGAHQGFDASDAAGDQQRSAQQKMVNQLVQHLTAAQRHQLSTLPKHQQMVCNWLDMYLLCSHWLPLSRCCTLRCVVHQPGFFL